MREQDYPSYGDLESEDDDSPGIAPDRRDGYVTLAIDDQLVHFQCDTCGGRGWV